MSRLLIAAIGFVLISPAASFAHRLDEYLQATRVSLGREHIGLEMDLTPGANIAPAIVNLLDRDGDGAITPIEAAAYGHDVLSGLVLDLDGEHVAMTLNHVEIPSIATMRDGLGTIQVYAAGKIGRVSGRRHLHLRNNHQPVASVYLVNALIPEDRDIGVVSQTRDLNQQSVRIDYSVRPRSLARVVSMMLVAAGIPLLLWVARTDRNRPGVARTLVERDIKHAAERNHEPRSSINARTFRQVL